MRAAHSSIRVHSVRVILSSRWRKEIVAPVAEKIMTAAGGAPVKTEAVKSLLVLCTLCLPG